MPKGRKRSSKEEEEQVKVAVEEQEEISQPTKRQKATKAAESNEKEKKKPKVKSQKTENSSSNEPENTPWEKFAKHLKEVKERYNCVSCICTHGVQRDDSDDESEDDEAARQRVANFTQEQIDTLRYVLITKERSDLLDKINDAFEGDQVGSNIMMFSSSDRWFFLSYIHEELQKLQKQKNLGKRFDHLFALTFISLDFGIWYSIEREGSRENVTLMAKLWKDLLKHSNEELGIDAEFTRAGVNAFLENAKNTFKEYGYPFKYK